MSPRPSFLRIALGFACSLLGETGRAAESGGNLIRMPAFEVQDMRPWTYAAIPGYEILSLENERDTRRIATEFQRAGRFMGLFLPADRLPRSTSDSVLFVDRYSTGETFDRAKAQMKITGDIDAYTLGGPGIATQFASAELAESWLAGRSSSASLRFAAASQQSHPHLPQWYRDGAADLLATARLTDTRLELPPRGMNPAMVPSLASVLAIRTQEQAIRLANTSPAQRARQRSGAMLLVRWGLFGDAGIRRAAFLEFAAAGGPDTEEELKSFFGFGLVDLQRSLAAFADWANRQPVFVALPRTPAPVPLVGVEARPASATEVARLVGGSYLALADQPNTPPDVRTRYHEMALASVNAPDVDRSDPRLVAVQAEMAFDQRDYESARRLAATALAGGVRSAYLHYLDAVTRLRGTAAGMNDGQPMAADELRAILGALRSSLREASGMFESYRLLAEVHLRNPGLLVPNEDLAMLVQGTREFPGNLAYLTNVALVHYAAGRHDPARELVERGLSLPGIEQAPQRATLLGIRRNLEQAGSASRP